MNKAIERMMTGARPLVDDAGQWSGETRSTLSMMREASREMSDGYYREMMDSISPEFYLDDENEGEGEADPLELGWLSPRDVVRPYRMAVTVELVDGFED